MFSFCFCNCSCQERERYVMKFIKIMKWLRKMNNFNSYLAILSALDSAPIRRLGEKYSLLSRTS